MTLNNDLLIWILGGVGGFILLLMRTTISNMQAQIEQLQNEVKETRRKYEASHEEQVRLEAENGRLRRRLDRWNEVLASYLPKESWSLLEDTDEYYGDDKKTNKR